MNVILNDNILILFFLMFFFKVIIVLFIVYEKYFKIIIWKIIILGIDFVRVFLDIYLYSLVNFESFFFKEDFMFLFYFVYLIVYFSNVIYLDIYI